MASLILFNKPFQVLSQFTDTQGRKTLADYLQAPGYRVAGRLDYDSEGLLLLTDDGRLQQQIANPRHKQWKTYQVQVEGDIEPRAILKLNNGVLLKDGMSLPAKARKIDQPKGLWPRTPPVRARKTVPDSWLELSIREGRNRQVRRMTAAVDFPTLRLLRARIADWTLEGLGPGEFKEITVNTPNLPTNSRRRR
ncbi:MAG: pseudouridine synthase [Halioglobus sp.]